MTCIKAQSMITPFINNKLNISELEEFLGHINSCSNCREELEFYYGLYIAMKQLDEDRIVSFDLKHDLELKMKKAQDKINRIKYTYYQKKAVLILLIILLAFFLGIHYAEKSIENQYNLEEKNFQIEKAYYNKTYGILDRQQQAYFNLQMFLSVTPRPAK